MENNKELICEDCKVGSHPQKLRVFRGDKASWMGMVSMEVLFCPKCGQIYTRSTEQPRLYRLTIDEYEDHTN